MPSPSITATIRDIQKITSFTGSGLSGANEDDEEDMPEINTGEHEQWATDKPAGISPKKKRARIANKTEPEESAIPGVVEKGASLMLSDDDIED